ncbi:MAG TPA: mannose-1-phosphate guanylyltransferase [Kiritimatiellia bacterium]|jgi:mannose-1-phosphate guanylyltransferase|nr:mannose-1-phosphate guanylyltransferase [Kiritimatiellia bacterium]HOR96961.1 mannose-1-phosphate guanylyltransferase [Kiritimatiellia bacterium]HPK36822.1 mannose-1-phosphate guanylyltransferase [Kiritimatiellia bacterium]
MRHAYAVILAGGSGERFWPLSTKARPKQFISLFGGRPLLALAVERLSGLIPADRILIITAEHLVEQTVEAAWHVPHANIIGEPCKRDTAPAVAVACGLVRQRDPEGVVCILTADQLMSDVETFRVTLADAIRVAGCEEAIVTIGIKPDTPATGFGYIEVGEAVETRTVTLFNRAKRFVEKPDAYHAARYVESGTYFWNAGMFIWKCDVMREALERFAPDLAELCDAVVAAAPGPELANLLQRVYPSLRAISIDYAVMEHAPNILVARGEFGWDDVGSWPAVAGHFSADLAGNVVVGSCEPMESLNNIVVSENRLTALIGVSNLVVVQSDNATLICPQDRAEDVKKLLRRIAQRPDGEKYV